MQLSDGPRISAWFDTMPGEQMAIRINSGDVGRASRSLKCTFRQSRPPLHYHKQRKEIFEALDERFVSLCGEEFEAGPGRRSSCLATAWMHGSIWGGAGSPEYLRARRNRRVLSLIGRRDQREWLILAANTTFGSSTIPSSSDEEPYRYSTIHRDNEHAIGADPRQMADAWNKENSEAFAAVFPDERTSGVRGDAPQGVKRSPVPQGAFDTVVKGSAP